MTKITLSGGTTIELSAEQLRELGAKIAEAVEGKAEFNVGDMVEIIEGADVRYLRGFSNGDIVEIISDADSSGDFRVKRRDGFTGYAQSHQLRHATAEEVAEYKAQIERNRIFTENGRKSNEYREGDIILYNSGFSEGVYEVAYVDGDKVHYRNHKYGNETEFSRNDTGVLSPVTFVEQRLDRKQ